METTEATTQMPTAPTHKTVIVILSDPKPGTEEALGRIFNALAVAHEAKAAGDDLAIVFSGAGTRWPAELARLDHPANGLSQAVRDHVQGASCGCAAVFGATEGVRGSGTPLVANYVLPGTPGVLSLRRYVADGWNTLVF